MFESRPAWSCTPLGRPVILEVRLTELRPSWIGQLSFRLEAGGDESSTRAVLDRFGRPFNSLRIRRGSGITEYLFVASLRDSQRGGELLDELALRSTKSVLRALVTGRVAAVEVNKGQFLLVGRPALTLLQPEMPRVAL